MVVKLNTVTFNKNRLIQLVRNASQFFSDLEKDCNFPIKRSDEINVEDYISVKKEESKITENGDQKPLNDVKKRPISLEEIHEKLHELRDKKSTNGKNEKRKLKRLKREKRKSFKRKDKDGSKKKSKQIAKALSAKSIVETKEEKPVVKAVKTPDKKVVVNKGSKIVYNKIDFGEIDDAETVGKTKPPITNPKTILQHVKKMKSKLKELEKSGETEKVVTMKETHLWDAALKRSEGQKVKDDEVLLKKTIKKKEQWKKKSKEQWETRIEAVNKKKENRQKKRQENIAAKKTEKKKKKLKRAIKKGRIFPE